jgi:NTE family protein
MSTALILTGGGARAAYQVGVLLGVKEICEANNIPYPFSIYSGCSAGAVNTAFLANEHEANFKSLPYLERLWSSIHTEDVYRSDLYSIIKIAKNLIWDIISGRLYDHKATNGLLDSSPLLKIIERNYDETRVSSLINKGLIQGVGVSAFNYSKNMSEYFFQAANTVNTWETTHQIATKTTILPSHIYASSAIPLIFPYVQIGENFYGDGSLRNYKPLNSSLHLGAKKIFVIGVLGEKKNQNNQTPSTSRIVGTMLNSILLDSTHLELHYIEKFNQLIKEKKISDDTMKYIDILVIRPSIDIGQLALSLSDDMPRLIQHLLRGLGKKKEGGDLISYLLFEPKFVKKLIAIGKQDALNQADKIINFFKS